MLAIRVVRSVRLLLSHRHWRERRRPPRPRDRGLRPAEQTSWRRLRIQHTCARDLLHAGKLRAVPKVNAGAAGRRTGVQELRATCRTTGALSGGQQTIGAPAPARYAAMGRCNEDFAARVGSWPPAASRRRTAVVRMCVPGPATMDPDLAASRERARPAFPPMKCRAAAAECPANRGEPENGRLRRHCHVCPRSTSTPAP